MVHTGKGVDVVKMITKVSVSRRCVRQDALLLALAICAKSNDNATKKAAYKQLSKICRTPIHLFIFVEFSEHESSNGKVFNVT